MIAPPAPASLIPLAGLLAAALGAAACGVRLDGGERSSTAAPEDAAVGGGAADAGAGPDAAAPPVCGNGRVVYLNFEGATLTRATTSDATLNRASWLVTAQGTAPRYRTNDANRAQLIDAITAGVRGQLASFPVTVVTQRPAAGPYVMIVLGGSFTQVGSRFTAAVNELDCGDVQKSDVAWISDNVAPVQAVVNTAIGAIGFGLGLTATLDPLGCMCGWDNNCNDDDSQPCRLATMIQRDPNADQRCAGLTTQDEVGAFDAAFCR